MATGTLTILSMVYNRLPFLVNNEDNTALIEDFIQEASYELENCFRIRFVTDPDTGVITEDWDRVGVDENYRIDQKSIIADLVASYILTRIAVQNGQGDGTDPVAGIRFLKRAKAGSAEVEWGQFSTKDGVGLFLNAEKLLAQYAADAARKARNFGCIIDICTDCSAATMLTGPMPFIVVSDCGCGC